MTFGTTVANEYAGLAIGRLAQSSAILRGYSHRGLALLGKLARVDAPDSLRVGQTLGGEFPVPLPQPGLIPLVIADEALEIAHALRTVQLQSHRLDILAFGVAQQSLQIQLTQLPRFSSPKRVAKQFRKLTEFPAHAFHLFDAQLELRRQLRFP